MGEYNPDELQKKLGAQRNGRLPSLHSVRRDITIPELIASFVDALPPGERSEFLAWCVINNEDFRSWAGQDGDELEKLVAEKRERRRRKVEQENQNHHSHK